MSISSATVLALLITIATTASGWAFTGVGGCNNLPVYYRAVGALEGMESACNMTVEQARRILYPQAAPAPRAKYGRHTARKPQS